MWICFQVIKVCWLLLIVVVVTSADHEVREDKGWTEDDVADNWARETGVTGQNVQAPSSPAASEQKQPWEGLTSTPQHPYEESTAASNGHPTRVLPGHNYQSSDQNPQGTTFYPKKEQGYRNQHGSGSGPQHTTRWGYSGEQSSDSYSRDREEDNERAADEPIYYAYEYKVHDPLTGDVKGHKELRDGDKVKGYYMLHDADGSMREVHYTADHEVGFTAVVSKVEDVAPPHKPSSHGDIFGHHPPSKSVTFHGSSERQSSNNNLNFRPSPPVFPSFNDNSPQKNNYGSDYNSLETKNSEPDYHEETDDEARHIIHLHPIPVAKPKPTPSYEEAYHSFSKKQPMPVTSESGHVKGDSNQGENYDEEPEGEQDEREEPFFRDEEFDSFDSKFKGDSFFKGGSSSKELSRPPSFHPDPRYRPRPQSTRPRPPLHLKTLRRPFINDKDIIMGGKPFPTRSPGVSIKHEGNAHSFQSQSTYRESRPTYETYEEERDKDFDKDESRSSVSIIPSSESLYPNKNIDGKNKLDSHSGSDEFQPFRNHQSFTPSPLISVEKKDRKDEDIPQPPRRLPFMGNFNVKKPLTTASPTKIKVEAGKEFKSKRNPYSRPQEMHSFSGPSQRETGFIPIPNPYQQPSSNSNSYLDAPQRNSPLPKRNAYKHSTSLSPDNSRFRSFKNNSFSDVIGNPNFENSHFPKKKLKRDFFDNDNFGKWPSSNFETAKWGNDDKFKGTFFDDDFDIDGPFKNSPLQGNSHFKDSHSQKSHPHRESPLRSNQNKEGPHYGAGSYRDVPPHSNGPYRDVPSYSNGPYRDAPSNNNGQYRDAPSNNKGPYRDVPSYSNGPYRDVQSHGNGPYREDPSQFDGPYRHGPSSGDGPYRDGPPHPNKGYDNKHALPKRETKHRVMQKPGLPSVKPTLPMSAKRPKITSIYDVMEYGGSDWPKKVRSSYSHKKPRKVFRRFSNRRYNDGKRKRSILPHEGYFPDRETAEQSTNSPLSLDYEYMTY